ncbi:hypothetical protein [Acetivibrio ethanolgignens]|uniref:DUF3887 domain-containing protein n=1 Tax=Acetivibrio ethanolgignens TaxID=290052 RepID=A0A0V8QAV8_9FIRM|nr:hypothetical protein [Acetivibrio ethanolgignens]KSV57696.1 hypothetical protein ASU35_15520 [Acetivibrio ethanolgignens]
MNVPINSKEFTDFISDNNLFQLTQEKLTTCLKNWWTHDKAAFLEDMNADLETVLKKYNFENDGVSFSKSYSYDPPMDYISVWIHIFDEENNYICEYTAFYDLELQIFDDKIK